MSVRSEILRRDKLTKLDKASMRRWVNSRFKTLVRRGVLEKHMDERGKAYFLVLDRNDEDLSKVVLASRRSPELKAEPVANEKARATLHQLKKDLEEYRLKAVSQLSEMEEYKRVGEVFPDLRALAQQKFEAAVDENCRVLGKIRALEQLLMSRESS